MKIEKYKKISNGKYKLYLDQGNSIELYEDTILKFDLLLSKIINENMKEILEYDKECEVYYQALKYLKTSFKSKSEVYSYLNAKDFNKDQIERCLKKLEQQGYINDLACAKSFVNNKILTTSYGPVKIKNELIKKGIDLDLISKALVEYTDEIQQEKIRKNINKIIKSNRNKSNKLLKMKIITDLNNQGFDKDTVNKLMSEFDFPSDSNIAKKEYDRLYKKLSQKYSGNELEFKIKQKMFQKGFDI